MSLAKTQIRGSSLLLLGRGLSVTINFLAQVIIVRCLSTQDFGAFAYALSVVAFFQAFSTLGLQNAIPRFVPIYHEKKEFNKLFGTMALVVVVIGTMVVLLAATLRIVPESFYLHLTDRNAIALLSIMAFLIPIQALDSLLGSFFASLTNPKTIFFRTHVLAPGIKLIVAILLAALGSRVKFLAYGYVVGSAMGVAICIGILFSILKHQSLLQSFRLSQIRIPARELFSFSIPVLSSELVTGGMLNSIAVFLLARSYSTTEVAFYRVVVPAAALNMTVMYSFSLLYTPLAARLFARNDYAGINVLYWKTTLWMVVLSLPFFLVTFSMATPVTVFLYGARYRPSGVVLAILSLGYFFNVALGLNTQTLRVFGAVRYILVVNLLSVVAGTGLTFALIPRFGAIGAAVGTSGTLIIRNVLTHAGLRLGSKVRVFEGRYIRFYVIVSASAVALLAFQRLIHGNVYASLLIAALLSVGVVLTCSDNLEVEQTFPELLKRGPIHSVYQWRRKLSEYVGTRLFKALDAVMIASSLDAAPETNAFGQLLNRRAGAYRRIAGIVNLLARVFPGVRRGMVKLLWRSPFPFSSTGVSLIGAGSGATVFLVNSPDQDFVVKVYRRSQGRNFAGLLEVADIFRSKYNFVASWYAGLVPREHFLVLHGPALGRPVTAAIQPYIGGAKKDLLLDFSDSKLLEMTEAETEFKRQLCFFAEQTIRMHDQERKCLDFLGRNNVLVASGPDSIRIWIIDNGVFDIDHLNQRAPDTLVRIEQQITRLRKLLQRMNEAPRSVPEVSIAEQSGAAAD